MATVWVNKNAKNYNVRTESEAFTVRSYIRGPYARRKRQESLSRLRSETYTHQKIKQRPLALHLAGRDSPNGDSFSDNDPEQADQVRTTRGTPNGNEKCLWNSQTNAMKALSPFKALEKLPHPITALRKGNSDPFNVTSIPLTARNNFVMKVASEVQSIHVWTRPWVHQRSRAFHQDQTLVTRVSYGKIPMLAALAWSYAQMLAFRDSEEAEHRFLLLRYLEYKDACLKELKALTTRRLTRDEAVALFEATIYLGEVEWFSDTDVVLTHFRAARKLLDQIGGIHSLNPITRKHAVFSLVGVTFTHPIRPLLDASSFDPGPWSMQLRISKKIPPHVAEQLPDPRRQLFCEYERAFGMANRGLSTLFNGFAEINDLFELTLRGSTYSVEDCGLLAEWAFFRRHGRISYFTSYHVRQCNTVGAQAWSTGSTQPAFASLSLQKSLNVRLRGLWLC
jgi:hypothetical protein